MIAHNSPNFRSGREEQALEHALALDDAYVVERVLARGHSMVTELVTLDGMGPYVRKRISKQQFQRELWARLAQIKVPQLSQIQTTYELPDEFVVVFEYIDGITLEQAIKQSGAKSAQDVLKLAQDLCAALTSLHELGIMHRDVAPQNIIQTDAGQYVLIDLGNARLSSEQPIQQKHTLDSFRGTWGFAAPEQFGFAAQDSRVDLYAAGRVLAFALAAAVPEGNTQHDLRVLLANQPKPITDCLLKACEFEPSVRFQSASQLLAAFERASKGQSFQNFVHNRSTWYALRKKRSVVYGLLAVGAVLAVAATLWGGGTLSITASQEALTTNEHRSEKSKPEEQESPTAQTNPLPRQDAMANTSIQTPSQSADSASEAILQLQDGYWLQGDFDECEYIAFVKNISNDKVVILPSLTATATDKNGKIEFSDTLYASSISPGQTIAFSGLNSEVKKPAKLEFDFGTLNQNSVFKSASTPDEYLTTNLSLMPGEYAHVTGYYVLSKKGTGLGQSNSVTVYAIIRNSAGDLTSFGSTLISKPAEGSKAAFDIPLVKSVTDGEIEILIQDA